MWTGFQFQGALSKISDLVTIEGEVLFYISWADGYFVLSSILTSVLGIFVLVLSKESQWLVNSSTHANH